MLTVEQYEFSILSIVSAIDGSHNFHMRGEHAATKTLIRFSPFGVPVILSGLFDLNLYLFNGFMRYKHRSYSYVFNLLVSSVFVV